MHLIKVLFTFLFIPLFIFSFNSCSEKEDSEDNQQDFVLINGVKHSVLSGGYILSVVDKDIWIDLIIEDKTEFTYKSSFIEFRLPLDVTEEWFHLKECESYWKVFLRNLDVGDNSNMNLISEGKILVKRLEEKDEEKDCKYQVAFKITLHDGTTAEADIQIILIYGEVVIGGR